jgi:hypothetical protein
MGRHIAHETRNRRVTLAGVAAIASLSFATWAFIPRAAADNHAANVLPIIREIRKAGATTLREIAEALNARAYRRRAAGNGTQ